MPLSFQNLLFLEASVSVPRFYGNQYGYSSYIAYEHPHFMEDQFEIILEFSIDNESTSNHLLLFMGNSGE